MAKKEKNEEKKNQNSAIPDSGLLRKNLGKRWKLELRGHHCSLGREAQKRKERREITEVNASLEGESHTGQGGRTNNGHSLGQTTNTWHGQRRDWSLLKHAYPWGPHLLQVQRQLLYPLPRVYGMQKPSHKKEKKKRDGRNVLKLSSPPRYNYRK